MSSTKPSLNITVTVTTNNGKPIVTVSPEILDVAEANTTLCFVIEPASAESWEFRGAYNGIEFVTPRGNQFGDSIRKCSSETQVLDTATENGDWHYRVRVKHKQNATELSIDPQIKNQLS